MIIMGMSNSKHELSNAMILPTVPLLPNCVEERKRPLRTQKSHFLGKDIFPLVFNTARADAVEIR